MADDLVIAKDNERLRHLLFQVAIILVTSLAFSGLLKRVMRSLGELTAAADQIGRGVFTPWLPPPGEDEIGRLSLAISGMGEQIREMLRQVEQGRQLAVIGEFASYLAHEIRNPLSSLKLNLQGVARGVRAGALEPHLPQLLDTCILEINRLDRVVQTILHLGHKDSSSPAPCSVHRVIAEVVELVRLQFTRRRITVEVYDLATADEVLASSEQLKGVFLNLFLNAADAMPDGGRLQVATEDALTRGHEPGIAIHVIDEGQGIPPELRDTIFDPFFTTKHDGSGLGLPLSLRSIRHFGGDLRCERSSEMERGAAFVITFPLLVPKVDDPIPALAHAIDKGSSDPWLRRS
jgi:signal transduction histidine kinase